MSLSGRSPGRPPVELDRILSAAVALVDDDGVDALTMRGLAKRLGSGTATLYRHFDSRDDLVAQVVDSVMGEAVTLSESAEGDSWQVALSVSAREMFAVLRRHPNIAPLMLERIPAGRNAVRLRERCLARLLHAGFEPPQAVRAWSSLARFVLGFGVQSSRPGGVDQRPDVWSTLDPEDFPASSAVDAEETVSLDDEFAFGLELFVSGLDTHARTWGIGN